MWSQRRLLRVAARRVRTPPVVPFHTASEYVDHLEAVHARLPVGFRVGTASFRFVPEEAPLPNTMTLTLIVPDEPTESWGAVFTRVCSSLRPP